MRGKSMLNQVAKMFQQKFKIKNKTKFLIYIKLTDEKIKLESVINARPGLSGKGIIGSKVTALLQKITDRVTDQVFDLDHENGSNEEIREYLNQRDRLVLNMNPIKQGFKQIQSGGSYRSSKLRKSTNNNKPWFLTVLTKQFLQETSPPPYLSVSAGCTRLREIPVGHDDENIYNVPHINTKLKTLQDIAKLVIDVKDGLMVVNRVMDGQQRSHVKVVIRLDMKNKGSQRTSLQTGHISEHRPAGFLQLAEKNLEMLEQQQQL